MSQFRGVTLPDSAVPSAYDLHLRLDPDVDAGSFTGTVAVNVKLLKEDRFIVLNGVDLSVDRDASSFTPCEPSEVVLSGGDLSVNSSTITSSSSKLFKFRVVAVRCYEEKIVLEFDSYLPRGEGVLDLAFSGKITKGVLICCGENEKKSARRFFPCWDEPVYKATFKITIQVPVEYGAFSNIPILEERVIRDSKTICFHESPNMATYLVTMVVGREAMQSMTLLRALFSRVLEQTGATKEEKEILLGDIVMNRETEKVSRVGREDDKLFLFPIDKVEKEELRKDEVVVVSRPFFHGQPVRLVTDRKKLGIICGIEMKVDLASSDGKTIAHGDIGTESLERNRRFVVGDTVVCGSWFGTVQRVEVKMGVLQEESGFTITVPEANPKFDEPIFKNAAEAYLNEPYYLGQEVIDRASDDPVRGVVTKHKVLFVEVDWIHCCSVGEEKKPSKRIWYGNVERIHDPRASRAFWALGSRCIFERQEFVIAGVRSMVKVKWQGGFIEEISSTELMESKEFFSGQFVAKKEDKGVGGCVRMVVDGLAWVKWFQGEHSELLQTSELQSHLDYEFQISDVVAKKLGSRARGSIVGMGNGKVEVEWWPSKTITEVLPEEITRLCFIFGEDPAEDEDEEGSSDDTASFSLGPIASSGSRLLEPASSSDEDKKWG